MKRDEAINLIAQVCAMYKGTLQEHQALQKALEVIGTLVEPVVETDVAK